MLPLTSGGMNLIYGFSRSDAIPKLDFEQYDLRSYAKGISFFLHQDIYDKDAYLGDMYIGVDGRDKETYTDTGLLNRDRLRIMRMGTKIVLKTAATVIFITPEISQGLNIFGARRKSEVSSRDAGNTFSKFNLEMQAKHSLNSYTQLSVRSCIQLASEKLTPQEEYAFGGIGSVRGYAFGDYYGDGAVQTNVELLCKPAFLPNTIKLPTDKKPLKECVVGLLFFDFGYGSKRGDIQGEKAEDRLASVGTGVRFYLYDQVSLKLEAGFPIRMGDKGITEGACPRLHIALEFEDKMLDKLANRICR
jgi:hemolysin activation/secretion protein